LPADVDVIGGGFQQSKRADIIILSTKNHLLRVETAAKVLTSPKKQFDSLAACFQHFLSTEEHAADLSKILDANQLNQQAIETSLGILNDRDNGKRNSFSTTASKFVSRYTFANFRFFVQILPSHICCLINICTKN
jgi:hypothetical protein